MVLYHLDHTSSLAEGQEIRISDATLELRKTPLSYFGKRMVSSISERRIFQSVNELQTVLNTYNLEIHAEQLRTEFFPEYPSRLSVLFGVKQLGDLFAWKEFFPLYGSSRICEIEYDGPVYEFDARFLRGKAVNDLMGKFDISQHMSDYSRMIGELRKYWEGKVSDAPLMEVLIPLPVKIKRCASLDSYPDFRMFSPFSPDA